VEIAQGLLRDWLDLESEIDSSLSRIKNLIATSENTISTASDILHEAARIETVNYSRIKLFVENQINSARVELAQALRLVVDHAVDQSNNQSPMTIDNESLEELQDAIQERLQEATSSLSTQLSHSITQELLQLQVDEDSILHRFHELSPSFAVDPLNERLQRSLGHLAGTTPLVPTSTALRRHCIPVRKLPPFASIFQDSRSAIPLFGHGAGTRLTGAIVSLCAVVPFLWRCCQLLFFTPRRYRIDVDTLEAFYHESVTTPWLIGVSSLVQADLEKALHRPSEVLEKLISTNQARLRMQLADFVPLLSAKGNLHAAVSVLKGQYKDM